MSQAELSTDFTNPRITPAQRRGASVVAAGWCLRNAGLRRGEPLDALPSELRELAAGDLQGILDALFAEPKKRRPL